MRAPYEELCHIINTNHAEGPKICLQSQIYVPKKA